MLNMCYVRPDEHHCQSSIKSYPLQHIIALIKRPCQSRRCVTVFAIHVPLPQTILPPKLPHDFRKRATHMIQPWVMQGVVRFIYFTMYTLNPLRLVCLEGSWLPVVLRGCTTASHETRANLFGVTAAWHAHDTLRKIAKGLASSLWQVLVESRVRLWGTSIWVNPGGIEVCKNENRSEAEMYGYPNQTAEKFIEVGYDSCKCLFPIAIMYMNIIALDLHTTVALEIES